MYYVVLAPVTLYAVWNILKHYNVFESTVGEKERADVVSERDKLNKRRGREKTKLDTYSAITGYFGKFLFSDANKEVHKFLIERLDLRSEPLERHLTPEELRGKYILILLISLLFVPLSIIHAGFLLFTVAGILIFSQYVRYYESKVQQEDEIIDVHFINLFLLLYSKLRQGSKGRIAPVVRGYIDSLDSTPDDEAKEVMMKFAKFLLNNLNLNRDDKAVMMLRERYRSATIVNFCNIATQALNGIDNTDTLLSTKMDLVQRKNDLMEKNADKLYAKGEKSIYLIYVILFIFIAVGWYSKLPQM